MKYHYRITEVKYDIIDNQPLCHLSMKYCQPWENDIKYQLTEITEVPPCECTFVIPLEGVKVPLVPGGVVEYSPDGQ